VKHACFTVTNEPVLDRASQLPHSNIMLLGDVLKLTGDHAKDPVEHDDLHVIPGRVIDGTSIREDVVGEIIALQGEQNLIVPVGVACGGRNQNSRDKRVNVLYPTGLRVKHGDDGGITLRGRVWWHARGGGGGRRQL
jgi:hypothetical protein